MTRKQFLALLSITLTIYLLTAWSAHASQKHNYLTLIYPVRGTQLWISPDPKPLNRLLTFLRDNKLPASFLFQYDALVDPAVVGKIRSGCPHCEFGVLLEVSERLATDSLVSYKVGDGSWTRPDKTFLSGYSLLERKRLIDKNFLEFKKIFGFTPTSIGGWYVDPYSLNYLRDKYGVNILVSVADQYNTDAQRYWGRPWGVPYYSQKYDLMSPAATISDKLDIVQIQWSQRHPTEGFGDGVWYSQNSFQANDYINNHRGDDFFPTLLNYYLSNDNPVNQVTIGLEVGQELTAFAEEHFRQLDVLEKLIQRGEIRPVSMETFARWYKKNFPEISPVTKISDGLTTWVNAPCYRLGIRVDSTTGSIVPLDLRVYPAGTTAPDNFGVDGSHFLAREVKSATLLPSFSAASVSAQIRETFAPASFTIGNTAYDFRRECQPKVPNPIYPKIKIWLAEKIESINSVLSLVKTSVIDKKRVIGVSVSPEDLFGFWSGRGAGLFSFPFQTLVKFQSPSIPNIIR